MKNKFILLIISVFILLGICGCGKSFEQEIVGNSFVYEYSTEETAYGNIITSQTLIFEQDGKGTSKIDIDFTGEFKEYADKNISYDTRHSVTDYAYTIDKENSLVHFSIDDDNYDLKYDKDSKCLIDSENEKIKFCK